MNIDGHICFLLRLCAACVCVAALHGCGGSGPVPASPPASSAPDAAGSPAVPNVPRAFVEGAEGEEFLIAIERGGALGGEGKAAEPSVVPDCWQPLAARLVADGVDANRVSSLLCSLGPEMSQLPMGTKANELYTAKYLRKPPAPGAKPTPPSVYKGVPTEQNAGICRDFMAEYAEVFARAEAEYGVPQNIAVALLFVETRLGRQVGKHQAARNLAAMAGAYTPAHLPDYIAKLPDMDDDRLAWLAGRIQQKADWAYAELKALIRYAEGMRRDPLEIPGSVYGAIGLCQFMPSNIIPYAKDGNGDGIIDLHCVDDAVVSLANYLSRNGWKTRDMTEESRRKALMRYNNSTTYVNTILALAKLIGTERPVRPAAKP